MVVRYTDSGLPITGASSVAPVILDAEVFGTSAQDVTDELLGRKERKPESVAMARGTCHEAAILDLWEMTTGLTLTQRGCEYTHPDHEWLVVHPDAECRLIPATGAGPLPEHIINVQAKSSRNNWPRFFCAECGRGRRNGPEPCKLCNAMGPDSIRREPGPWGPQGSMLFPECYYVQVMVEMAVMRSCGVMVERTDLAVGVGPNTMDALWLMMEMRCEANLVRLTNALATYGRFEREWPLPSSDMQGPLCERWTFERIAETIQNTDVEGFRIYQVPWEEDTGAEMLHKLTTWYETEVRPYVREPKE